MPRVEVLTEVSEPDARAVVTEHVSSEMLADKHYADQLVERAGWARVDAEQQEQAINADNGGSAVAAPARAVRRATARRASDRRATARSRQGDRAQGEAAAIADQIALEPAGERDQVTASAWFG